MSDRPRWPWYSIVFLEVLQLLSLLPWLVLAGFSIMAFDSFRSGPKWQPWAMVAGLWSYPAWLLAAGVLAWFLYGRRHYWWAVLVSLLFTLPIPVILFAVLQTKVSS